MVAPPVELIHGDLDDPAAWPPGATLFDQISRRFLEPAEADVLARGIDKAHRHSLVCRPLVEVVPGILYEGYNVLSAPPRVGKTVIAHQLMVAVDMGRDWLGRQTRQGPVLFYGLEDTLASVNTRDYRLLGDGLAQYIGGGAGQIVVTDAGGTPAERMEHLEAQLERGYQGRPFGLVVIDTAARFVGTGRPDQDAYSRGLELYAPLDRLGLRHHAAILGVHHDRKDPGGDDAFDAVSGGLSICATAQSVLSLRRTRGGDTGVLSVFPRAAAERRYALAFDRGEWSLSPEMAAEMAAEAAGCRRDVVAELLKGPATLAELVGMLSQYARDNVRQALHRLKQDGRVQHDPGRRVWSLPGGQTPTFWQNSVPAVGHDPLPVLQVVDQGPCDQCGARPGRVNSRGARYCAGCAPRLFPTPLPTPAPVEVLPPPVPPPATTEVVPPSPATARYWRPDWAPEPLGHPITTWNRLVEEAFRNKRVSLIAHPYPTDADVPPPLRKRPRGRGTLLHEGRHAWHNPDIPAGIPVRALDRNGGYLGALGTATLPIGRLVRHDGRGPTNEVGAHRLDRWPDWTCAALPHPGGPTPRDPEIWISTPTLVLLNQPQLDPHIGPFTVLESWTGRGMRLDTLQAELRDARRDAIAADDKEFEEFLKAVYSLGISTVGESSHNTRLWRPDWNSLTRATFHANMWRSAHRAYRNGFVVAAVKNTDELHLVFDGRDPFTTVDVEAGASPRPVFTEGRELKDWKQKDHYLWDGGSAARRR